MKCVHWFQISTMEIAYRHHTSSGNLTWMLLNAASHYLHGIVLLSQRHAPRPFSQLDRHPVTH